MNININGNHRYGIITLLTMIFFTCFGQEIVSNGILYRVLSDNTIEAFDINSSYVFGETVTLPNFVKSDGKSYEVVGIADNTFKDLSVYNFNLNHSLRTIGDNAFPVEMPLTLSFLEMPEVIGVIENIKSSAIIIPSNKVELFKGTFSNLTSDKISVNIKFDSYLLGNSTSDNIIVSVQEPSDIDIDRGQQLSMSTMMSYQTMFVSPGNPIYIAPHGYGSEDIIGSIYPEIFLNGQKHSLNERGYTEIIPTENCTIQFKWPENEPLPTNSINSLMSNEIVDVYSIDGFIVYKGLVSSLPKDLKKGFYVIVGKDGIVKIVK